MVRILLIFILNIFLLGNFYATHLVGGNLAYEFVGIQPNGDFRYTLKLNYYFDCGLILIGNLQVYPTNMSVGVYAHNDPTQTFILLHQEVIPNMEVQMLIWFIILPYNNILR